MHIVQSGITQPPTTFIENTNAEKFSYDSYLAISAFNLLSYVVGVEVGHFTTIKRLFVGRLKAIENAMDFLIYSTSHRLLTSEPLMLL